MKKNLIVINKKPLKNRGYYEAMYLISELFYIVILPLIVWYIAIIAMLFLI